MHGGGNRIAMESCPRDYCLHSLFRHMITLHMYAVPKAQNETRATRRALSRPGRVAVYLPGCSLKTTI